MLREMGCENTPPAEHSLLGNRRGRLPQKLTAPECVKKGDHPQVDALPRMSGPVMMTAPGSNPARCSRKVCVVLSVYCNSYDGYAVVSQDNLISRDCGYLSLKHCRLLPDPETDSFQLVPDNKEGQSMAFWLKDSQQLSSWVNVIRGIIESIHGDECVPSSPNSPRSPNRRPLKKLPQRCPSLRRKQALPSLREEASEE